MQINNKLSYLSTSIIDKVDYNFYKRKVMLDLVWRDYEVEATNSYHTIELLSVTSILGYSHSISNLEDFTETDDATVSYIHYMELCTTCYGLKLAQINLSVGAYKDSTFNLFLELENHNFYFQAKYISIDGELSDLQEDKVIKPRTDPYYIAFWQEAEAWHKNYITNQVSS